MDRIRTVVRRDGGDGMGVEERLSELSATRTQLMAAGNAALAAMADASPLFPSNAAGTLAYFYGTRELRAQFLGKDWWIDRKDGVETVVNEALNVKIGFQNVDLACDGESEPNPRSPKGAGSERACIGNLFGDDLPHYVRKPDDSEPAAFFLMVDRDGAMELSRPVIGNRGFVAFVERIILTAGGDLDPDVIETPDNGPSDDGTSEIEITIDRK